MDRNLNKTLTINCKGELIHFSSPRVMGILTPDSFYDGGRYMPHGKLQPRIEQILGEGADFIDLGAASTRPGAEEVPQEEEWARLAPALELLAQHYPGARVSVDTYRAEIARRAVEDYGACMVNDIAAGGLDPAMFDTVARLQVTYVMMHIQGKPRTMQQNPHYDDLVRDIIRYFAQRIDSLAYKGLNDILIDPGFGFGKTLAHNYQLLEKLDVFRIFERPVVVGISRKSMIYKILGTKPEEALNGTTALHALLLRKGAHILRVHDVAPAKEVIKLMQFYNRANESPQNTEEA